MTTHAKFLPVVLAGLMTATALAGFGPAFAADTKAPQAATAATEQAPVSEKEQQAIVKTVDEAFKGLRETRAARLAIFNGSPEMAVRFVAEAKKDLEAAKSSMGDFSMPDITPTLKDDSYIPFDSAMAVSEGFVPTAEKEQTLNKANEHLAKGENKEAIEALKLANIDVTVSAAFLPAKASLEHVNDAEKLLKDKKYYEANLALKAIEDSIVTKSFGIDEVPAQGKTG